MQVTTRGSGRCAETKHDETMDVETVANLETGLYPCS